MMTFSTQEELWKGFLYCLVFSFFFGALFGGILAQEKKQYAVNINQIIAKKMIIFGFLALPIGVWWGWSYVSTIYRLECHKQELYLWRIFPETPVHLSLEDVENVEIRRASLKGDHWALHFFVEKDKSFYTTALMPHINAQRVIKKISDLRTQGCE